MISSKVFWVDILQALYKPVKNLVTHSSNSQKRVVVIVTTIACLALALGLFGYGLIREAPKRVAGTKCAGPDQTVDVDSVVQLVGNHPTRNSGRVDPNGTTLNYRWELSFLNNPNNSNTNLKNPSGAETSFVADVPGTFQATLWVTNNAEPFIYCRTPDTVKILVKD